MTQATIDKRLRKVTPVSGQQPVVLTPVQVAHIRNSLQYAIETFEQTCGCGICDPCTNGSRDLEIAVYLLPTRDTAKCQCAVSLVTKLGCLACGRMVGAEVAE